MSSKVQLVSDLHLEFLKLGDAPNLEAALDGLIVPAADTLLVAGDTAPADHKRLGPFLRWMAARFRRVLFVPGNHEFYGLRSPTALRVLGTRCMASGPNVTLMNRTRVRLDDDGPWDVLGATLWSHLPEYVWRPLAGFSDFTAIKNFGPPEYVAAHELDVAWLTEQLATKDDGRRKLVLTHHPPATSRTSNPVYEADPDRLVNAAFGTDLPDLVSEAGVWAYGHTHWPRVEHPFYSNPRGYSTREVPDFRSSFVITLPHDPSLPVLCSP